MHESFIPAEYYIVRSRLETSSAPGHTQWKVVKFSSNGLTLVQCHCTVLKHAMMPAQVHAQATFWLQKLELSLAQSEGSAGALGRG